MAVGAIGQAALASSLAGVRPDFTISLASPYFMVGPSWSPAESSLADLNGRYWSALLDTQGRAVLFYRDLSRSIYRGPRLS